MFRHVVMFTWSPEATDEQKAAVSERLAGLPDVIPEIKAYQFGPDAGLGEENYDFVVVADFADRESFVTYRDHPLHQTAVKEAIAPIRVGRATVQYEL